MTGLGNRWHVKERLAELSSGARRHGQSLAVLMIDLDRFKEVNDLFGHPAGDAVLKEVARRLTSALRHEDVAGRWGGDELLAVLPFTDLAAAQAIGERVRATVRAEPILLNEGASLHVTVSVGCAAGVTDRTVLVPAADEALYEAKRAGRDTVHS